jgi:hypothetical protein
VITVYEYVNRGVRVVEGEHKVSPTVHLNWMQYLEPTASRAYADSTSAYKTEIDPTAREILARYFGADTSGLMHIAVLHNADEAQVSPMRYQVGYEDQLRRRQQWTTTPRQPPAPLCTLAPERKTHHSFEELCLILDQYKTGALEEWPLGLVNLRQQIKMKRPSKVGNTEALDEAA